jgi:hypothetical protein
MWRMDAQPPSDLFRAGKGAGLVTVTWFVTPMARKEMVGKSTTGRRPEPVGRSLCAGWQSRVTRREAGNSPARAPIGGDSFCADL